MFHSLSRLRRITRIDLSQNIITNVGLQHAIEEISEVRRPSLVCMRFNDNKISDEGAIALFEMLEKENQISEIGLAENCLTEDFSYWLTGWLKV